jgi:hypothetical protein
MKLFGGLMLATASAQLNVVDWLKAKYQSTQLDGVNQVNNVGNLLGAAEQAEVMLNLNDHSPQMGMNPLSLMMTGGATGISKTEIVDNMKNNLKNQMYSQFQSMPINPAILSYAQGGGSDNTGTLSKSQLLYSQFPDPMGTILRMKKSSSTTVRNRAGDLMKKMVARNMLTDDPYLPDLFVDNDKQKIKDYLFAKQLDNADPYMKTLLYRKFNSGSSATSTVGNKDLMKTQFLANQFGDSINKVNPNDAYLMFKFLQTSAAGNAGRVPANIILDVALGSDVAGIKANEFAEKFGVTAAEYVCAAHEESIRVPCMVNQETVTPGECAAQGCCYNKLSEDGSTTFSHGAATVPICYHNLLGKIGSGIARHMINDDNIKSLFGGSMPRLEDLTEAQTWAESQMPDVIRRLVKEEGSYYGMPSGQGDWWSNMYDSSENKFSIYATPAPATREFEWKPHGPTAMPGAAQLQIPEVGGFLNGDNSATNPVNDLDFIIGNHVDKIRGELNSNSYTCRLIPKENMVNCYDNNYDALSTSGDPAGECEAKGCCFREVNLFEKDNLPVCYRSLRSGYCDLPSAQRAMNGGNPATGSDAAARDNWWVANPYREECGAQGISRGECLLNPQCCFDTNPRREGEAHCYKRGGVESLFNQKTGKMADQCDLTAIPLRESCFDGTSKMGKLLNRIATEDQCHTAGCCFSQAAADASSALGVLGTMNMAGPHCFKRPTLLDSNKQADNYADITRLTISDLSKVCANDPKWPELETREWNHDTTTNRWTLTNQTTKKKLSRQPCTANGTPITDRHTCIYTHGCCFEKSSNPINPWCYKARLVKTTP